MIAVIAVIGRSRTRLHFEESIDVLVENPARIGVRRRSSDMPMIVKRLRFVFYLLATVELVLASLAWGSLALH